MDLAKLRRDMEPKDGTTKQETMVSNQILLVQTYGQAWALYWDVDPMIEQYLRESCAFDVAGMCCTNVMLGSDLTGILVGKAEWTNLGPGDWPDGGCDYGVEITDLRLATVDEWTSFCSGNHPFADLPANFPVDLSTEPLSPEHS
jgi:hypothetical protein